MAAKRLLRSLWMVIKTKQNKTTVYPEAIIQLQAVFWSRLTDLFNGQAMLFHSYSVLEENHPKV